MRRVIFAAVCAAVLALPATGSAEPLTFNAPQYVDQTFPGGEPVLQVDTVHHTIVYSSHEGTTHVYRNGVGVETLSWLSEYRNQTKMWVSKDGGLNWTRLNFNGTGFTTDPTKNTGFSDPDFAEDAGGRIYNTGINLANDALFSSGDGGYTWDKGTVFCASGDRPWLAGGKPDEVFMGTNVNGGGHTIYHSTDGGNSCSDTIDSPDGVGKIYYDHTRDVLVEPAYQGGGTLGISVWHRGESQFTFHKAISDTSLYAHWPAIAIDGAGTVYLVWDTDASDANGNPLPNKVLMMSTKDLGQTWTGPVTIAAPTEARVFWPWVAAGDKGKVSVVWYQTDHLTDVGTQPSKLFIYDANVLGADSESPTVNVVNAGGRVISEAQQICQNGTTCVATGEDRRLGDFFTNAIDERGCVVIASGDTMLKDPVTGGERNVSAPIFIRQSTGPRLIGSGNCSGNPDPVAPAPSGGSAPTHTPPGAGVPLPSNKRCTSSRRFRIRLRAPKGQTLASATVFVNGKRAKVAKRGGRLTATVDLRGLRKRAYVVKIVAITGQGRKVTSSRRYHTCKPGSHRK